MAEMAQPGDVPRRPRGQQRGKRGHGRTRLLQLPSVVQDVPGASACPRCGAATTPAWGCESAEVLEIEVRAYRRIVRRPRSRPSCGCGCLPGLVTAAAPDALWPRHKLGVSIWVELLLSKFLYGQPTARLLQDWTERGLPIAQGTATEGLQRLAPLFKPMLEACLGQVRSAAHWHADETRWEVFEDLPGKTGHRWYLWVFKAQQAVVYVLDPSRSAAVPGRALAGADGGILSVDRYAAYRKFARCVPGMRCQWPLNTPQIGPLKFPQFDPSRAAGLQPGCARPPPRAWPPFGVAGGGFGGRFNGVDDDLGLAQARSVGLGHRAAHGAGSQDGSQIH